MSTAQAPLIDILAQAKTKLIAEPLTPADYDARDYHNIRLTMSLERIIDRFGTQDYRIFRRHYLLAFHKVNVDTADYNEMLVRYVDKRISA